SVSVPVYVYWLMPAPLSVVDGGLGDRSEPDAREPVIHAGNGHDTRHETHDQGGGGDDPVQGQGHPAGEDQLRLLPQIPCRRNGDTVCEGDEDDQRLHDRAEQSLILVPDFRGVHGVSLSGRITVIRFGSVWISSGSTYPVPCLRVTFPGARCTCSRPT